jgi:hypothetical protein
VTAASVACLLCHRIDDEDTAPVRSRCTTVRGSPGGPSIKLNLRRNFATKIAASTCPLTLVFCMSVSPPVASAAWIDISLAALPRDDNRPRNVPFASVANPGIASGAERARRRTSSELRSLRCARSKVLRGSPPQILTRARLILEPWRNCAVLHRQ